MLETNELTAAPIKPQMFGNAGREHMKKYGKTRTSKYCIWNVIIIAIHALFHDHSIYIRSYLVC